MPLYQFININFIKEQQQMVKYQHLLLEDYQEQYLLFIFQHVPIKCYK